MVRHHIMARLGLYFHTIWMNPAQPWRKMLASREEPALNTNTAQYPGFSVYSPDFWLPEFYRPNWLAEFSLQQRLKRARRVLAQRGCRKTILYLWLPEFESALRSVPFDLSCYHLEDEYSYSRVELPTDPVEARVLAAVDQVFILSPALFEKKGAINPNSMYVPGGVDFAEYSEARAEPADLAAIPHPRIGYVGSLKWQLDWALLLQLTQEHPEWSFVFVGPPSPHPDIAGALRELSARHNVHFLGGKPTQEMVAYPQHFDVCIMPYGVNAYTKYIYPLKLHEYLATGRPTVGARIRSLEDCADVVALPGTPQEWSAAIQEALRPAASAAQRQEARREMARRHDWGRVVERIALAIAQRLGPSYANRLSSVLDTNHKVPQNA
jgi:glycosyltransferase involved in cell wall biosynthesis